MRRPPFAHLALALAALLAAPDAAAAQQWTFAGMRFPATIDTLVAQRTYRWVDNPELGAMVSYVIPGESNADLTVYLYPVAASDSLARRGLGDAARDASLSEARAYALERRGSPRFDVDSSGTQQVRANGRTWAAAFASFSFMADSTPVRSHVWVIVRGEQYLKVRLTYPASEDAVIRPRVPAILARIAGGIEAAP